MTTQVHLLDRQTQASLDGAMREIEGIEVELDIIAAKPKRPFRDLILIIDIVGGLALITGLAAFIGPLGRLLPEGWLGLMQNLSVELLGTWLSIRVLEYIVRRRDEHEAGRTRLLRMCRYWLTQMSRARSVASGQDAEHYRREKAYLVYMQARFAKLLHSSEIVVLGRIVDVVEECVTVMERIAQHRRIAFGVEERFAALGRTLAAECALAKTGAGDLYLRWVEAADLLRRERTCVDALIFDFTSREQERGAAQDRVVRITAGVPRLLPQLCEDFFEAVSAATGAKSELNKRVSVLSDLVQKLEADIRQETPERWV